MPKLKTRKHISNIDYSAYGYAGTSIEQLDVANLPECLEGDATSLNGVTRGKSLLDLALDNIDYAIEEGAKGADLNKVFEIISILIASPAIEKGVYEDGSSPLSKLLDKMADCNIKKAGDKSNGVTLRAIKQLKGAIHDLAQQYDNKEEFLRPLLDRPTIVQDIESLHLLRRDKGANRLVIENDVLDNALRSGLQAQGREREIVAIDKRSNKEARDVEAAQYTVDGTDWSKRDRVVDLKALLKVTDPLVRGKTIDALVAKLQEHDRMDQLMVLKNNGLVDGSVFAKVPLFKLYAQGDGEALNAGLDAVRDDINARDAQGYTMLHMACLNGQTQLARKLMEKEGVDAFVSAPNGMTPVHMLALSDHREAAVEIMRGMRGIPGFDEKMMAQQGKDSGFMPTMLAIRGGNTALAEEFLKATGPEQARDIQASILYRAVRSDDVTLVENFFKTEASKELNPTVVRHAGEDIDLMMMAMGGDGKAFKAIMEAPNPHVAVSPDMLDKAVEFGKDDAMQVMLDFSERSGAKVDISVPYTVHVEQKKSFFRAAKDITQEENILNRAYRRKIFLEEENIDLMRAHDNTPDFTKREEMQKAMASNEREIEGVYRSINKLLAHNVAQHRDDPIRPVDFDVNAALRINMEAYNSGARKSNVLTSTYSEVVQIRQELADSTLGEAQRSEKEKKLKPREEMLYNILNHPNADLNIGDEFGQNLLMLAAQSGDRPMAGVAILRGSGNAEKGSEPWLKTLDAVDSIGNTALFYAAQSGQVDTFELLLSEGATLRSKGQLITNNGGINPLMAACSGGHHNVVQAIDYSAADVARVDAKGNTAMHYLAMGSVDKAQGAAILKDLVETEAKIDARNKEGKTPLMLAVINNNTSLVQELLSRGADVNLADKQGNTPLIYACLLNDRSMIETVLSSGNLDVNHQNKAGISAYLVIAQRDGLESLSAEAEEKMLKNLDAQQKAAKMEEIKAVRTGLNIDPKTGEIASIGEPNTYPGLTKVLISRGADPYASGPVNLMDNVATVSAAIAAAKVASANSQVVANGLPMYGGIASEFMKLGTAVIAGATVRSKVKDTVKASLIAVLTNGTDLDKRVDLGDTVMIGSVHDKGIGFVKHGTALERDIKSHNNFVNTEKSAGIYTLSALREAVTGKDAAGVTVMKDGQSVTKKDAVWCMQAHDDLTAKYTAVQKSIENQPWYYTLLPWKGIGLNNTAKEILEADKVLQSGNGKSFLVVTVSGDEKTFERAFGGDKDSLVEVMKSPKLAKRLLSSIIANPEEGKEGHDLKIKEVEALIDRVVNKEISVAPDTFYSFSKFSHEKDKAVGQGEKNKESFLKANKPLAKVPTVDTSIGDAFAKSQAAVVKSIEAKGKMVEKEPEAKVPAMFARGLAWLTGDKSAYAARNKVADAVGEVTGSAAGAYTAAQLNPQVKSAMIQTASAAASVAADGSRLAIANPIATAATVAAAAVAYNREVIVEKVSYGFSYFSSMAKSGWNSFFSEKPKAVEVKDVATASNIDASTQEAFVVLKGNTKEIENKEKFDIKVQEREIAAADVAVDAAIATKTVVQADAATQPGLSESVAVPKEAIHEMHVTNPAIEIEGAESSFKPRDREAERLATASPVSVEDISVIEARSVGPNPTLLESVMGLSDDDHEHSSPLSEKGLIPDDMHTAEEALVVLKKVKPKVHNVGEVVEKKIGKDVAADMEKESGVEGGLDVVS